jgi:hypothetical protein
VLQTKLTASDENSYAKFGTSVSIDGDRVIIGAPQKANDMNKALQYIAEDARDTYEYNFNLLKSHIDEISSTLHDIELDEFRGNVADYNMWTEHDGEKYNFLVRFVKDKNGVWKVKFF